MLLVVFADITLLNERPVVGCPAEEVDAESWVAVVVAVVIMIDQDIAVRVGEEAFAARAVDVSMGAENDCSSTGG